MEQGRVLADKARALNLSYLENHFFDMTDNQPEPNNLVRGDNLGYMSWLLDKGYAGKIKMIYIDPPFFTKAKYNASISLEDADGRKHNFHHLAYDDTFERSLEFYICNVTARLILMKELLAEDGTIWVHLDWHSSHYVKIILDELLGEKNFINEIIWSYKSGGSSDKHFSKKHDTILVYSKSSQYYLNVSKEKSYNRDLKPYKFKGVEEYRDDYGWYTMVNMKDVWTIDMVGRTSKERTGYATQKPLELVERIVCAATQEGDLCADFFCGSGSMLEAAERSGRRWLGCDVEELALGMCKRRLDMCKANYVFMAESAEDSLRHGRLDMKLLSKESLEGGKYMYTYRIDAFKPDIDIGHIPLKERQDIELISRKNPETFIDYIMIDFDYNGTFDTKQVINEGLDKITVVSGGKIAFIAVDVFGREYYGEER